MVAFPQRGGCLCGDVEYWLAEDPVTLYVCHCTDCQRQSGTSFALSMTVRRQALRFSGAPLLESALELPDGRRKDAHVCARCYTRLWSPSRVQGLATLEPGTLDDTSWLRPVAHIWTRSAQPWVVIPEAALRFEGQPRDEDYLTIVRAWKSRRPTA